MRTALLALALSPILVAQSNAVPGYDIDLYDLGSRTVYRVGPSGSPTGTAAIAWGHSWCNSGTEHVPWEDTAPDGTMIDTYPKLAFLLARQKNGRMEQISNRSFLKYSYATFNFSGGPCGPCQSGPSGHFRLGCRDTYGASTNASFFYLGPAEESNPWLGTWESVGSYWDAGDPPVSGAAATDNRKSLNFSMTQNFNAVKNRVQVPESVLLEGGQFYAQSYAVIQGEPVENRGNNIRTRPESITWNGSGWSYSSDGPSVYGSVLEQWTGATHAEAGNCLDDGRFCVAVKVTGPVGGMYHYEYAVQNIDNDRGGATLRIAVDAGETVTNVGSKDIDSNGANDWVFSRSGDEIVFMAGTDNALEWNTIYNFWFDCSAAPGSGGAVIIDQARPGPGASSVAVPARMPGTPASASASVTTIGQSCGAAMTLSASDLPVLCTTIELETNGIPASSLNGAMMWSFTAQTPVLDLSIIGMDGCELYGTGDAFSIALPSVTSPAAVPFTVMQDPMFIGVEFIVQTFTVSPGLNTLGVIGSNGLLLKLGL